MIEPTKTLEQALKEFDRQGTASDVRHAEEQLSALLSRFPLSDWPKMTLQQYALGQQESEDTFCRWMEFRSRDVGSIRGGSARKLIIYKHKDKPGWYFPKEFKDESEAWETLRSEFTQAFELARRGEWDEIDELPTLARGPALRLKTLHLYFPDEILPIFSAEHLRHFLDLVKPSEGGASGYDVVRLNRSLRAALRAVPDLAGWKLKEQERFLYGWSHPKKTQRIVKIAPGETVPKPAYAFDDYVSLAAHGWLNSQVREGNRFRHAVWQGFGAQPAADAALLMQWLASQTGDAALQQRLRETERDALSIVPAEDLNHSAVSHIRPLFPSLVFGHVAENAEREKATARGLLTRFEADGSIPYRKTPGKEDYSRTHFAPDANGLTAQVVETLLEAAAFSGDRALIDQAVQRLHGLNKFKNTVPRGAQTWEVPLHTPDILASAHLVRAYTLGYELTGKKDYLDQAIYWAWTGVPFVYLTKPVDFPDTAYGTIAVYGATGWRAPVWFGRPVQWCGLVYANALYRLIRHDPAGPWKQLADGITSTGLFYSWPRDDRERQGLLPDVWEMLSQTRAGPAINPGTVQVNAVRLYGKSPLTDFRVFPVNGQLVTVHAPGEITRGATTPDRLQFTVKGWTRDPYFVLVNGFTRAPQVKINGQPAAATAPHQFQEKERRLILRLGGESTVELFQTP